MQRCRRKSEKKKGWGFLSWLCSTLLKRIRHYQLSQPYPMCKHKECACKMLFRCSTCDVNISRRCKIHTVHHNSSGDSRTISCRRPSYISTLQVKDTLRILPSIIWSKSLLHETIVSLYSKCIQFAVIFCTAGQPVLVVVTDGVMLYWYQTIESWVCFRRQGSSANQ